MVLFEVVAMREGSYRMSGVQFKFSLQKTFSSPDGHILQPLLSSELMDVKG